MQAPRLLIVGASARAACQSAERAGFAPWALDRFGDRDLLASFPSRAVKDYPQALVAMARKVPPMPWLYTGALENYPQIIARIGTSRLLLGNPGHIVSAARDPWRLARCLGACGLKVPQLAQFPSPPFSAWLRKPYRSAAGARIRFADAQDPRSSTADAERERFYYQQYVAGLPCSALYVAGSSRAVLLGAAMQLIGSRWAGATGFRYVGSVGPLEWEAPLVQEAQRIGNALASSFQLAGLFGVDFILCEGRLWTLEVNPRYTASVEVLERFTGLRAIAHHVHACQGADGWMEAAQRSSIFGNDQGARALIHGKAILCARWSFAVPDDLLQRCAAVGIDASEIADIPQAGTTVPAGHPVLTIFATGQSMREVQDRLQQRAAQLYEILS